MRTPGPHHRLAAAAAVTIVVGLVAAAASSGRGEAPWLALLDLVDWPPDGEPARFARETSAVNAVVGGVMVGWGTLMFLIATGPFGRGDTTFATPMLVSVAAWFLVDSTASLIAGLPGNVVLNIGFLVLFVPPLVELRRRPVVPAPRPSAASSSSQMSDVGGLSRPGPGRAPRRTAPRCGG